MALTSILAPGTTSALSDPIVIASGVTVNVAIYGASGAVLPLPIKFAVEFTTSDAPTVIDRLDMLHAGTGLTGPGTFRVRRPAYTGDAFGVCVDA